MGSFFYREIFFSTLLLYSSSKRLYFSSSGWLCEICKHLYVTIFGSIGYLVNLGSPSRYPNKFTATCWYCTVPIKALAHYNWNYKKVVIVHTHYNFFSHLQRFFQQFYIWATIFTTVFFGKIVVKSLQCARALTHIYSGEIISAEHL